MNVSGTSAISPKVIDPMLADFIFTLPLTTSKGDSPTVPLLILNESAVNLISLPSALEPNLIPAILSPLSTSNVYMASVLPSTPAITCLFSFIREINVLPSSSVNCACKVSISEAAAN